MALQDVLGIFAQIYIILCGIFLKLLYSALNNKKIRRQQLQGILFLFDFFIRFYFLKVKKEKSQKNAPLTRGAFRILL